MATGSPLSYSSYRTYTECPLRWKYLYVDRLPELPRGYFTFGRVVHRVLEELLRPTVIPGARRTGPTDSQRTLDDWHSRGSPSTEGRIPSREELLRLYESSWSADGYTTPEEEARYRALGREILLRYYARLVAEPPRPIAVEEHLEASWDGLPVHGYVDRIDRSPEGGLEVVDYKTSRELSGDDARESDQLSLYQVLVESNYAEKVDRLTLYHLRSLTPHRVPARGRGALLTLHEKMGSVADGIRSETFEPTPGRHCARCDFRDRCPEFRAVPGSDAVRLRTLVDKFEALRAQEHALQSELRQAAEELHRASEGLGVHRIPGSREVAIRRKEEVWRYDALRVREVAAAAGLEPRIGDATTEEVRRLLRDPEVEPEVRRRLAETGTRRVKWYWELEDRAASGG